MSLIVGEGVGKYYGALDVFKNLSFRLEPGDHIGMVGANGEGKTTLLRLLAGLEEPTSAYCSTGAAYASGTCRRTRQTWARPRCGRRWSRSLPGCAS